MTILETGIATPTGPEFNPFDPQFLADGGISMIPQLKLARVVGGALIGAWCSELSIQRCCGRKTRATITGPCLA
jgi:hypothetical protein